MRSTTFAPDELLGAFVANQTKPGCPPFTFRCVPRACRYSKATDGGIDALVCAYRSPTGRACLNKTGGAGGLHCTGHTCPTQACANGKSSKQPTCDACAGNGPE